MNAPIYRGKTNLSENADSLKSSYNEEIIYVKKLCMNHWALIDCDMKFLAPIQKCVWKIVLNNIPSSEKKFQVLAESTREPMMISLGNILATKFEISEKYKNSEKILRNYITYFCNNLRSGTVTEEKKQKSILEYYSHKVKVNIEHNNLKQKKNQRAFQFSESKHEFKGNIGSNANSTTKKIIKKIFSPRCFESEAIKSKDNLAKFDDSPENNYKRSFISNLSSEEIRKYLHPSYEKKFDNKQTSSAVYINRKNSSPVNVIRVNSQQKKRIKYTKTMSSAYTNTEGNGYVKGKGLFSYAVIIAIIKPPLFVNSPFVTHQDVMKREQRERDEKALFTKFFTTYGAKESIQPLPKTISPRTQNKIKFRDENKERWVSANFKF